jgi:hypothetical protein
VQQALPTLSNSAVVRKLLHFEYPQRGKVGTTNYCMVRRRGIIIHPTTAPRAFSKSNEPLALGLKP